MEITQTLDIAAIERFLRVRGWKQSQYPLPDHPELAYISADGAWRVELDVAIGILRFDLSEVDGLPMGYPHDVGEVDTVDQLEAELVSLGAIPWECPYCGEVGGEPATFTSRPYLYGADADGNRGEMRTDSEQRCTKCVRKP